MGVYERIVLNDLEVNQANDRHGELVSEAAAIEWLLVNKTEKMKELLQDIVAKNGIIEEPLVMKKSGGSKYIVYDGNRRVTCLKLLHGITPKHIKNPLDKKIEAVKAKNNLDLDIYIECRVEESIDIVNDILELRHIPGNSGAGRIKWAGHEKENFLKRTGKSKKINFAREINQILIDNGYLNSGDRIPLSTFNRLFSSRDMRSRVGVDVKDNQIQLINDRDASYKAMARIAKDMMKGNKTLDDFWNNMKKTAYLDELEQEKILPSAKNRLKRPQAVSQEGSGNEPVSKKPPQAPHRSGFLLPTNLPTPIQGPLFSLKFCGLFYELQNTLCFRRHPMAISISFRAFIEILTNSYIRTHGLNEKGSLSTKIKTAFFNMQEEISMKEETRAFINKLSDENEYFSINTLHKVAHHDMQISEGDLRSYVNNLDAYLREAITSVNNKQQLEPLL